MSICVEARKTIILFEAAYNSDLQITIQKKMREDLELSYGDDDFYGAYIEPCMKVIEDYCNKATKDLPSNYPSLVRFLDYANIDSICVFGHGFDGVDKPYYTDILIPRYNLLPWTFVSHNEESKTNIEAFCCQNGIRLYQMKNAASPEKIDLRIADAFRTDSVIPDI